MAYEDRIRELEEELSKTKYNKATQLHIGKLKAKIAALKERDEVLRKSKGKGLGFGVRKTGHATVVMVGLPSVGKSTLINQLTNASSKVGAYEFTTLDVIPGMMSYNGVNIQLLDLPGLITGAAGGKGRGREVLSMVRNADMVLIILDVNGVKAGVEIKKELEAIGVRLDKKPPAVVIKKRDRGGITVSKTLKLKKIDDETIKSIMMANGVLNADVIVRKDLSADEMIDAVIGNRVYIPSLVVVNKIDLDSDVKLLRGYLPISAVNQINLERLREIIFAKLNFIRIYLKPQGGKADYSQPLILENGSSIQDLCMCLHKDFIDKFRYALVWGGSVKHDGQRCGLIHVLKDKDTVSIVKDL